MKARLVAWLSAGFLTAAAALLSVTAAAFVAAFLIGWLLAAEFAAIADAVKRASRPHFREPSSSEVRRDGF